MQIQENVSLANYSTMRLGGAARFLGEVSKRSEIAEAIAWAAERNLKVIVIGSGSNIVWRDEGFDGLVIVDKILGIERFDIDEQTTFVSAGGGENWDELVGKTVAMGLSGLELLSMIPGTVGAAPVQNIGAYGCQLSDILSTIEAYDTSSSQLVTLRGSDCDFGYRTSRFKTTDRNRFFISKITLQLTKSVVQKSAYHSLESYLEQHQIYDRTPQVIRDAVCAIRSSKLPDPKLVANCGSFFANPIISHEKLSLILENNPDLARWHSKFIWEQPDGQVKIAAAALIENAGFKGTRDAETGMATWDKQALVLVNESAKNTADLLKFKQKIVDAIQTKFNITLDQEPELLP